MGIPDGDLSPRGTGMGKKCPPQAFVGIPAGNFFCRGDGFGELKPDGEFPVAIPDCDIACGSSFFFPQEQIVFLFVRNLDPVSCDFDAQKIKMFISIPPPPPPC
jgi:hypothetical protein